MSGAQRRAQILDVAADEFAARGLHGASVDAVARAAGITQAYVFRMFGTKKALFQELVAAAFDGLVEGMLAAAGERTGVDALAAMGEHYFGRLADETALLLQLQGFAAASDPEVRETVRSAFAGMWSAVADRSGMEPVTVKTFIAYGMLLNAGAALNVDEVEAPWSDGVRTRIEPGLFRHITSEANSRAPSP